MFGGDKDKNIRISLLDSPETLQRFANALKAAHTPFTLLTPDSPRVASIDVWTSTQIYLVSKNILT